jgi:hypothetical protein
MANEQPKSGRGSRCLWVVGVILVLGLIGCVSGSDDKDNTVPSAPAAVSTPEQMDAWGACHEAQQVIRSKLKAPSTAKFPSCSFKEGEIATRGERSSAGNPIWHVVHYVDAENSFGAMLRNRYIVTIEDVPGSRFRFNVAYLGE